MITGIGSLPHVEPADATAFALAFTPDLPAAPSLPQRSPHEGMLAQAAAGMTGVAITPTGDLTVDGNLDPAQPFADENAARPTGEAFAGLDDFLSTAALAPPARVKLQVTGPVTFGLALLKAGAPTQQAFAAAATAVSHRAAALLTLAKLHLPATQLVVFLDEPAFVGVGHTSFPLATEAAVDLLSSSLASAEHSAMTGVHCCGPADWRAVLAAGPNVLSLPTTLAVTLRSDDVSRHLDAGGWIAWGAVPTDGPLSTTADRYWRALTTRWTELGHDGVDPSLLRERAIITPACGLANHTVNQARRVFEFCAELDRRY